jgi:hypothetical protein
VFLLDTGSLGQIQQYNVANCTNPQIPQSFLASPTGHIHGSPVYYVSPTLGPLIYLMPEADFIRGFSFNGSRLNTTPVTKSLVEAGSGMPGGFLSVSANGAQSGTGIVWASMPFALNAEHALSAGVLRAFDASDLSVELWHSRMNPIRDDVGNFAKFVPPTIANGKVYVATFSGQLVVYGLNPPATPVGVAFVQVASAVPQSPAASVSVSYPVAQVAGDTNVVVVGWRDTTTSIQSVTDSAGNAYTLAVGPTKGTGLTQSIYYAKNIVAGTNRVTVTFGAAAAFVDVRILEYYGLDPANPVDTVTAAVGNSTESSSGALTTTIASELLFAANTVATPTIRPAYPFAGRTITNPNGDIAQDAIVNATGSYEAKATLNAAGDWVMQMVAFKAGGAAPTMPAPTISSVAPNSGATTGATAVTLAGTGFASGATVTFDGTAADSVVVVNSTTLTANTPAHAAGAVSVVITNPDGQAGTLAAGFTYIETAPPPPPPPAPSPAAPPTSSGGGALPLAQLLLLLVLALIGRERRRA